MSGASSAIAIGATPPTSASTGTGIWVDRTGMYGLTTNVVQTKFDAVTGKITAGGGSVWLDANGIGLYGDGGTIKFDNAYGVWTSNVAEITVTRPSKTYMLVAAYGYGAMLPASTVDLYAEYLDKVLAHRSGISFNSDSSAPNATLWGKLSITAGLGVNGNAAQGKYASGGAAPAGGTGATAGAYDTAAHRDALITLVNNIRTALVNNGIMS